MSGGALVLAHQGGWDEVLLVLTPVTLFAGLLYLANRRANTAVRGRGTEVGAAPPGPDDDEADPGAPPG